MVNVCTAIATGVNADGQREILGVDVFTVEDGAAWTSFLRGLVASPAFAWSSPTTTSASRRPLPRCCREPAGSAAECTSSATC
jgi:Transposase, Mutator family